MGLESSRVLKASSLRELQPRVTFNFEDLRIEGEEYLARIQARADELLKTASEQAAKLKEQAHAEGYEAGRQKGFQDAATSIEQQVATRAQKLVQQQVKTLLPALDSAAKQLADERLQWRQTWDREAVQLSLAMAEKILRRSISIDPAAFQSLLAGALEHVSQQSQITVHLSPVDLAQLGPNAADIVRAMSRCAEVQLAADAAMTPGGCRIETRQGEVDAQLETQLARFAAELLDQPA